ncbi:hydrogenase-2 assembly chaperone [[Mannheimia] succiniciproducens]|uniref:HybE protein n=1 Tax=Mannheimia succiniciproducens (strain KCTC 0769BP / MBEL55E) TaxID=221988 RepID=Q65PZ4_MANSM|nr:hydrogenase-2 assembly chaperone [[Mannheimia] succiniciproducens]AAU38966.1 unknown [[Mannheimia] succiniciproducens MBEL55E]
MYNHNENQENSTALLELIDGFEQNPAELFQTEMEKVAENMKDLPFYREDIPCFCPKFVQFENQWIGMALTPWMLSVLVLPGPNQQWKARTVGDKIALAFPYKTLNFTVSSLDNVPQYLSCSLHSPLEANLSKEHAVQLTKDCLTMLLSLPIKQKAPSDLNRRNMFGAMLK